VRLKVALLLANLLAIVRGQSSNVPQCVDSYQWSITNGQTPCLVAAYLETACGTPTKVDIIPPGTHYLGPTKEEADDCRCNTVTYSLVSACGGCQDRTYVNWTTWHENCSKIYEATFPLPIPPAAAVPRWAYLNISQTTDNFDPIAAAQIIGVSLSPTLFPATTVAKTTTVMSTISTSSSPSATPSATPPGPDVAAIAGGAVGGLVGFALIMLVLITWYMRRRSRRIQRDIVFDRTALVSGGQTSPVSHTHSHSYNFSSLDNTNATSHLLTNTASPLIYSLGSPYSTSHRSLESTSASMMQFGATLHPNRHAGFRAPGTSSDQGHLQI